MYSVYKIWSQKGDMVYYGSTGQKYKSSRFNLHRSQFRTGRGQCTSMLLFKEYGIEHCLFQIIKECETKEESLLLEKECIENNKCVNKFRPIVSQEEKNEDDRKRRLLYRKLNPLKPNLTLEEIKNKKKEYYKEHKDHKKEYDIKYREENKEKYLKENICECGGKYKTKHKSTHLKTKFHKEFELNKLKSME
jgi:hypothetical protein